MATASRRRLPYHWRLFLLLLTFSWVLVAALVAFHYGREKHFKAELLNDRLQLVNTRLADALLAGASPAAAAAAERARMEGLRITLIDPDGRVRFDTEEDAARMPNHLGRREVAAAAAEGEGFTTRRLSESLRATYFYAALRLPDGRIVRSALPHTVSLAGVLRADSRFLWFMLGVTLLVSAAGFLATRRLGHSILRLREFSERAGRDEPLDSVGPFPHDELGDISSHIVSLYRRLQEAVAERDREHARALHEQQEKVRIKKQLTQNINHELKTPVASIRGYLETLLANPGLEAGKRRAFLEKCCEQSERLTSLLADIATVTRLDEAGELIRLAEPVEIGALLRDIAAHVALLPLERRLRVHCELGDRPVVVRGNARLLESVFRNLTDNATAYSGGRDILIRLVDETPDAYAFLFADNGIGVPEEHLPHLFERFYRIDKGRSRKMGGTGLGLSIVRNAVALHGGRIEVRNGPDGGLEFRFTLRKRPDDSASAV